MNFIEAENAYSLYPHTTLNIERSVQFDAPSRSWEAIATAEMRGRLQPLHHTRWPWQGQYMEYRTSCPPTEMVDGSIRTVGDRHCWTIPVGERNCEIGMRPRGTDGEDILENRQATEMEASARFRVTDHGWRVVHPGRYRRCFQNLFTIMRSVDNPPFEGRLIMTTILEPLFHEVYVNETLYMYGPPIIVELVE